MEVIFFVSLVVGVVTVAALSVFCLVMQKRGVTGGALSLASWSTLIWLSTLLVAPTAGSVAIGGEALVILTWVIFVARAAGLTIASLKDEQMRPLAITVVIGATLTLMAAATGSVLPLFATPGQLSVLFYHLCLIISNVVGLVLLEQLAGNVLADHRWRIRYLIIGAGVIFGVGLCLHVFALVWREPAIILKGLQPAYFGLAAPFLIVASLRNRANKLKLNLSRNFVFKSGVLMISGVFLLLVGTLGYLAQLLAGDMGLVLAVFAGIASIALFSVLIGSSVMRRKIIVLINKSFFEFKFDYRAEWMQLTARLTEPSADFDLLQQCQRSIARLLESNASAIWLCDSTDRFQPRRHINASNWMNPPHPALQQALLDYYARKDWIIDLAAPPADGAQLMEQLNAHFAPHEPRYLVPLKLDVQLIGVVFLQRPEFEVSLTWEDYDILKMVSKQCAGFIALDEASTSLVEQEQLVAMNQMSAFLLHDLKTINAQLSLMIDNAQTHKTNPQFVDAMLATTENAVDRMGRIIEDLRRPDLTNSINASEFDLVDLVREMFSPTLELRQPTSIEHQDEQIVVVGDAGALSSAITHIYKNAVEAAGDRGHIHVNTARDGAWGRITISDDGPGMSEEFVRRELFTPFRTSKGLQGMGIGAYQARTKLRECGGDITVETAPDQGARFHLTIPVSNAELDARESADEVTHV